MKTIVFTNKKGGVGKSTSALCTAAYLSQLGKSVLAIDMDSQANFTQASSGEEGVKGVFDFLKGEAFEKVVQHGTKYDFIGADKRLSKASSEFDDIGKEHLLEGALKDVSGYDYVVIDTPPSMEILTLNALTAADDIIICCQSDGFSVAGLADMKRNIEGVQKWYNSRLVIAGILLTRYNPRTQISKQLANVFAGAAASMNTKVFRAFIRENTALKEAAVMKQDIFSYRPDSNGAKDYAAFVDEYLSAKESVENNLTHEG